jgi:hypothetical protein
VRLCMSQSDPLMLARANNDAPECDHVTIIVPFGNDLMMNFLLAFQGFHGKFSNLRSVTLLMPTTGDKDRSV